jgi:hypothetical protein
VAQVKKDEKVALHDAGPLYPDIPAGLSGPAVIADDQQNDEQGDPLYMIAHEIYIVSRDGKRSAAQLRKVIADVYPQSSKEESMRFFAAMTRMLQAADVAQRMAREIHDSVINKVS